MLFPVSPMPLAVRREPFNHLDWIFELKLDGFRALAVIENRRARLISRKGHVYQSFDDLCTWLGQNIRHDCILDGELVCLDPCGRPLFKDLLYRRRPVYFFAFDALSVNGEDLRGKQLLDRKRILRSIIPSIPSRVLYTSFVPDRGVDLYQLVCEQDLEGIVAKWKYGVYAPGPQTTWVKVKNPRYSQGEGRRELFERRRSRNLTHDTKT